MMASVVGVMTVSRLAKTIVGSDSTIATSGTAVDVDAPGVSIENFELRDAAVGVNTTAPRTAVRATTFHSSITNGTEINAPNAVVQNNEFDAVEYGIILRQNANGATIQNNNIVDSEEMALYASAGAHQMHSNNLKRNPVAIDADRPQSNSITEINASNNYWGRPGGPLDSEIQSPVQIQPFLTDPVEQPNYQIANSNIGDYGTIVEGETVQVHYTVENEGGTAGSDISDSVVLLLDGTVVAQSQSFELGAGGTVSSQDAGFSPLTFDVSATQAVSFDNADLTVSVQDDSTTQSVGVDTAPSIVASISDAPDELTTNDELEVEATVSNTGEAAATGQSIELNFGGSIGDSQTIDIAGESSRTLTLSTGLSDSDAGSGILVDVLPTDGTTATVDVEEVDRTGGGYSPSGSGDSETKEETQDITHLSANIDAPATVEVGEEVTFDAAESTATGTEIVGYTWSINGESVEGDERLTHSFDTAGEFTIEVTVEDATGNTSTASTAISVLQVEESETTTPEEPTATEDEQEPTETTSTVEATTTTDDEGGPGALLISAIGVVVLAFIAALYLVYGRE